MTADERHALRHLIDQARRTHIMSGRCANDCQCQPCRDRRRRRIRRSPRIRNAITTDQATVTVRSQVQLVMTMLEKSGAL